MRYGTQNLDFVCYIVFVYHLLKQIHFWPISPDDEPHIWILVNNCGNNIDQEVNTFSISQATQTDYVNCSPWILQTRVRIELVGVHCVRNDVNFLWVYCSS